MEKTIEQLQQELKNKVKSLDLEQLEAAERHSKELANRRSAEELELAERSAKIRASEELHAKRKLEQEEEEKRRQKEHTEARLLMESKQNALDEQIRIQREKFEWLEKEIEKAKFLEERYHKSTEETVSHPVVCQEDVVDNSHILTGESAVGTGGDTPDTPLMSEHLKSILRQARNY